MAKVLVEENSLQAIAAAIRAKNGSSATYTPSEMAAAISALSAGAPDYITFSVTSYAEAQADWTGYFRGTIDAIYFLAERGMTWSEFIDSVYNPGNNFTFTEEDGGNVVFKNSRVMSVGFTYDEILGTVPATYSNVWDNYEIENGARFMYGMAGAGEDETPL